MLPNESIEHNESNAYKYESLTWVKKKCKLDIHVDSHSVDVLVDWKLLLTELVVSVD